MADPPAYFYVCYIATPSFSEVCEYFLLLLIISVILGLQSFIQLKIFENSENTVG